MTNGTENNAKSPAPAIPAFKPFSGAKLVPLPRPISQQNEKESFPVFLAVGIGFSLLALITVFILSFTTAKKHPPSASTPASAPIPSGVAHQ